MQTLRVQPIPAFSDNYIWLIHGRDGGSVAIVDPGDAGPVLRTLQAEGLTPAAILITHRHGDHVGGVAGLRTHFPNLPVYGPARESIPQRTHPLGEGDVVDLPELGLRFSVWDVPGHTAGHIAYLGHGALLCGDTLFAAGCGRVFDGSLGDLHHSLARIAALPPDTHFYCAHEYTLDNLGFARWVEPDNPAIEARVEATHRADHGSRPPTGPWTRTAPPPAARSPRNWPPIRSCASGCRRWSAPPRPGPATPCTTPPKCSPPCAPGKTPSTTDPMMMIRLLAIALLASLTPAQAAEPLSLQGSYQQGGLLIGHTEPGSSVSVDGTKVRVSPEGVFLVGFHRDAPAHSRLEVSLADGRSIRRDLKVTQREYKIQRIDGLPPSKVSPNQKQLERIWREAAIIKKARRIDTPATDFVGGFEWPLTGRISGVYGSQRILNGKPRQPHYGVDVARPVGTRVRAPAGGVVTLAEKDLYFTGGTLTIDHGHGLSSWFLHLSKLLVKKGDRIEPGQEIAEVGATGRVTGPHLDWRMNLFDKRIDPTLLVGPMPPAGS